MKRAGTHQGNDLTMLSYSMQCSSGTDQNTHPNLKLLNGYGRIELAIAMRMSTGGTQHPTVQSSVIASERLLNQRFHCIEHRRTEISAVRLGHDAATRDVLQTRIELEPPKAFWSSGYPWRPPEPLERCSIKTLSFGAAQMLSPSLFC